jgi:isopentenyl-diphosphate delta-isomerase
MTISNGRQEVVLVNAADETLGTMEKLEAHERGALHRALSVLITRTDGRLLLQRRSLQKYHSGGLWTNATCTHPGLGETPLAAAHQRLWDEMGMRCELTPAFAFVYRADVGQGLHEHEFDHVFLGVTDRDPRPNADEVADWCWMDPASVRALARQEPHIFTPWFPLLLAQLNARSHLAIAGGVWHPR